MNQVRTICVAMCSILIASCENSELVESQVNRQITMTATDFKYPGSSRTSIDIGDNGGAFSWSANDTVGIFPNEGGQVYFPITKGAGTNKAIFSGGGWALRPSSSYVAYYPFVGNMYLNKTKIPVDFTGQVQTSANPTLHLGAFDFMASKASTPTNGSVNFLFQHLAGIAEFTVTVPQKGDLTSFKIISDEAIFTTKGYFDLTKENLRITPIETSKSIELKIQDITTSANNEVVKLYMMIAPSKLMGKNLKVEILNNNYTFTGSIKAGDIHAGDARRFTVQWNGQEEITNHYTVKTAGTLSQLVGEANKFQLTNLKVAGELNGTDIRFIREMAGRDSKNNQTTGSLAILDMSEAKIVEGGDAYYDLYVTLKTKNKTLSDKMFTDCKALTKIILPNSIDSIEGAFKGCSNLSEITIPKGIKTIGPASFEACEKITSVALPEGLTTVRRGAFKDCHSLVSINFPSTLKVINGFEGCTALENVTLPDGVTTIEDGAFNNCENLAQIKLPTTLNYISGFNGCYSLRSLKLPEGLTTIGDYAFSGAAPISKDLIPESVTTIGKYAFAGSFTGEMDLPNVTSLGEGAFSGCNITSFTLPPKVTEISPYLLSDYKLDLKTLKLHDNVTSIGDFAFSHNWSINNFVVPHNVKTIGNSAFEGCVRMSSIEIPEGVITIGGRAFEETRIRNLVIPSTATNLVQYSLTNVGLSSNYDIVRIKSKIKLLHGYILSTGLIKELFLPSTLEEIDFFNYMPTVNKLYLFAVNPPRLKLKDTIDEKSIIYVPKGSVEAYRAAEVWKTFTNQIQEMPEGYTEN